MRKLTYYVAITLDGFISGPAGEVDFFPMHDEHMESVREEYPETVPTHLRSMVGISDDTPPRHFDTVVMGRRTHDPGREAGFPSPYSHLRQVVFSTTLDPIPGVEVVSGDPVEKIRALKAEEGMGIWLCGGGNLAAQLRDEIDELVLKVNPVVCGSGVPLFADGFRPEAFTLQDLRRFDSGVVRLHYTRQ